MDNFRELENQSLIMCKSVFLVLTIEQYTYGVRGSTHQ